MTDVQPEMHGYKGGKTLREGPCVYLSGENTCPYTINVFSWCKDCTAARGVCPVSRKVE